MMTMMMMMMMMMLMMMLVMIVVVYDVDGGDGADYGMVVSITTIIKTSCHICLFWFLFAFKSMYLGKIDVASCVG